MNKDFTTLIGRPYEKVNCWQLAREFYLKMFNIELKTYCDFAPEDREDLKELIYSNVGDFVWVEKPEFGDLILIKIHGVESHLGIYVGPNQMLHSSKTTGSVIDKLERWERNIVGYYRHRPGGK